MHRPLEWEVVVRAHPCEGWKCPIHGLEVAEVQRIRQPIQHTMKLPAEPWLPRLHARRGTSLNVAQRVVGGDVADRLNVHSLKLLDGAGVDSWQPEHMVIGDRVIAALV